MNETMNRKSRITNAQLDIIQTTGKLSSDIRNILTSEEKNNILHSIENVNNELAALVSNIHELSDALNLDFNKIIGG